MCGEGFEEEREREGKRNAQNRNQSMASRFSTAFVGMFTNHFSDGNCCSEALTRVCLMVLSDQLEYAHLFG